MQRSQVRQSERGLDRPCWLCRLREGAVCPGSRRDPAGCADAERAPCAQGSRWPPDGGRGDGVGLPLGDAGEECILPTSGADPVVCVGALICRTRR